MVSYWPTATYKTSEYNVKHGLDKLFTQDGCTTMYVARDVLHIWAENFHLLEASIERVDGDKRRRYKIL